MVGVQLSQLAALTSDVQLMCGTLLIVAVDGVQLEPEPVPAQVSSAVAVSAGLVPPPLRDTCFEHVQFETRSGRFLYQWSAKLQHPEKLYLNKR
jgi:hypothetical protein